MSSEIRINSIESIEHSAFDPVYIQYLSLLHISSVHEVVSRIHHERIYDIQGKGAGLQQLELRTVLAWGIMIARLGEIAEIAIVV